MIACWLVKIAHFVFYFAQWSRNRPFQMKKYFDQTTEVRRRKTDQHSGREADQQEKKKLCVCASAITIRTFSLFDDRQRRCNKADN